MTRQCYLQDCAAEFKEQGQALSSSPVANNSNNAWIVNFNNGNDNNNNKNNNNYVRLVRSSECLPVLVPPSVCLKLPLPVGEGRGEGFNNQISPNPSLQKRGISSLKNMMAKKLKGSGEGLKPLYHAFTQAKKRKKPSYNRLMFEQDWLSKLLTLQTQLSQHTWQPLPSVCFVAKRPKAREIHAPDFADRVVHHWLVPQLEAIYEPMFINDSYANRKGKGTHAAAARLQQFVRQVQSGQGGGYYLQLDIHNFFNSIHRPTLYGLLKSKLQKSFTMRLPLSQRGTEGDLKILAKPTKILPNPPLAKEGITSQKSIIAKKLPLPVGEGRGESIQRDLLPPIHALLRHHPKRAACYVRATQQELALVPPHKRLGNAAKGCGLPIGNLSSQFFANVYLNELDQFIKHTLKVKRYVRYVDDFVLVHQHKAQLEAWLAHIQHFLHSRLHLRLKDDIKLQPLSAGIDFLGYWLYPTHTLVRPRVIEHAHQKLSAWQSHYVRRTANGWLINASEDEQAHIRSVWASYMGHFKHANHAKLELFFYGKYPWLTQISPYQAPTPSSKKTVQFCVVESGEQSQPLLPQSFIQQGNTHAKNTH